MGTPLPASNRHYCRLIRPGSRYFLYNYINYIDTYLFFVSAFFNIGLFHEPFILSVELVGYKFTAISSVIINIPFVAGGLIQIGIAYFFRDFRTLLKVSFLPPFALIFLWFLIPESPRWLISKGRFSEAKKILLSASKVNGHPLTEIQLQGLRYNCSD